MDNQRKLWDRNTALDLLSNESLVRINAEKTEAQAELLDRLSGFWDQIGVDFDALLTHDACELIPVFQVYAEQRYDSYAKQFVAGIGRNSPQWSTDVIDRLSNEIRPPRRPCPKGDLAPSQWAQLEPYVGLIKDGLLIVEDDGFLACDWEVRLTKSFHGLGRRKQVNRSQMCEILFRLKYRDYLRWYPAWMEFDRRLRLHLSDRCVSGPTRPQMLTPIDAVPAVNSTSVEIAIGKESMADPQPPQASEESQPPVQPASVRDSQGNRNETESALRLYAGIRSQRSQSEKNQPIVSVPSTAGPSLSESAPEPVGGENEHVGIESEPISREECFQAFVIAEHPGATFTDVKHSARAASPSTSHLQILEEAMHQGGLNAPKLAHKMRALLKPTKGNRLKVDRTTVYRIIHGETKKPQPEIREALIRVLGLKAEEASIVRRGLGGTGAAQSFSKKL